MRFLVTGIGGFAARHLVELLLEHGHEVCGLARRPELAPALLSLAERFAGFDATAVVIGDVQDAEIVAAALHRFQPDGVFHLAAQSSVGRGEAQAAATFAVNTIGTLQVLAAVRRGARSCRVLVVGSGESYGSSAGGRPLKETTPLNPVSVYGASKAACELLVRQGVEGYGIDALCVRAFNQTGPGQSSRFVCADFARQVVAVERGSAGSVSAGNLDIVRDFADVRDAVRAYWLIWQRGERGGVYNAASGVGRRIGDILDDLRARVSCPVRVEQDPARVRAVDIPALIGDNTAVRVLGWEPRYAWRQTIDDLVADWRWRLQAS